MVEAEVEAVAKAVVEAVVEAVLKAVVVPTLTSFCRIRSWEKCELKMVQSAASYAIRSSMGMDALLMQELRISDVDVYAASRWDSIETEIRRVTFMWLGHVARMSQGLHGQDACQSLCLN